MNFHGFVINHRYRRTTTRVSRPYANDTEQPPINRGQERTITQTCVVCREQDVVVFYGRIRNNPGESYVGRDNNAVAN